jgi:cell division protein FtsB
MKLKRLAELKRHATSQNIVLLAALVICAWWAVGTVQSMEQNYNLQRQIDEGRLKNEVQLLANESLRLEQAYYQTDEYLELMARDKLGRALPGERLVNLPRTDYQQTVNTGVAVQPDSGASNFEKWIDFLFGQHANDK